jgi:predicted lipoprotein
MEVDSGTGKLSAHLPVPLSTSITTAEGVAWVRNRQSEVHMLDVLQGRTLARTLGIQIGFNANDGD